MAEIDQNSKTLNHAYKTKELIALALATAQRCEPCIGFHARALGKLKMKVFFFI